MEFNFNGNVMEATGKLNLFDEYNTVNVNNKTVAQLKAFLDNVSTDNAKMVTTKCDASLFDFESGELLSNVNGLMNRCKGLSVWATKNDIGVRFNQEYIDMFSSVPACKMLLDNVYQYRVSCKERRYSFESVGEACRFLGHLYDYYKAGNATKEVSTAKEVIA